MSKPVPQWVTSWPDWYGIHGNVSVVPAVDFHALQEAVKSELPSGMVEMVIEKAARNLSGLVAQAEDKFGTATTASVAALSQPAQPPASEAWKMIDGLEDFVQEGCSAMSEDKHHALQALDTLRAALRADGGVAKVREALETVFCNMDEHGDPVGAQPESEWEKGYAAGLRHVYRVLKGRGFDLPVTPSPK